MESTLEKCICIVVKTGKHDKKYSIEILKIPNVRNFKRL